MNSITFYIVSNTNNTKIKGCGGKSSEIVECGVKPEGVSHALTRRMFAKFKYQRRRIRYTTPHRGKGDFTTSLLKDFMSDIGFLNSSFARILCDLLFITAAESARSIFLF